VDVLGKTSHSSGIRLTPAVIDRVTASLANAGGDTSGTLTPVPATLRRNSFAPVRPYQLPGSRSGTDAAVRKPDLADQQPQKSAHREACGASPRIPGTETRRDHLQAGVYEQRTSTLVRPASSRHPSAHHDRHAHGWLTAPSELFTTSAYTYTDLRR